MRRMYNRPMADFRFFHPIEVRYGDLDPQGHLNNAKYLTYFEQARVQYFIQLGLFNEDQSFMEIGVILADAHVAFLAPIHYGDDLRVGVRTSRFGNKSMTVEQNIVRGAGAQELAKGEIVMVAFDYRNKQTIPVPRNWRERITEFEKGA
ncbi:MAG TPA: thioesterase family protein [Anaerolineales bacterium]|nr:thioesterase family protein [Anaerolineales bacterium]